jgi:hypothetical protein
MLMIIFSLYVFFLSVFIYFLWSTFELKTLHCKNLAVTPGIFSFSKKKCSPSTVLGLGFLLQSMFWRLILPYRLYVNMHGCIR